MSEYKSSIFQQDYILSELMTIGAYEIIGFTAKSPNKTNEHNQDAIGILPLDDGSIILAVADGAGGYPNAEKVSLESLEQVFATVLSLSDKNLSTSILEGIEKANQYVLQSNLSGKTTLTLCKIKDSQARFFQIGDSGAIVSGQKGALIYYTIPQSPVGYGVEAGLISEKESLDHPQLHQVSNVLGEQNMSIYIGPEVLIKSNDTILLASDGIMDNFTRTDLVEIIRAGSLEEVVSRLISIFQPEEKEKLKKNDDYSFILCRLSKNN